MAAAYLNAIVPVRLLTSRFSVSVGANCQLPPPEALVREMQGHEGVAFMRAVDLASLFVPG